MAEEDKQLDADDVVLNADDNVTGPANPGDEGNAGDGAESTSPASLDDDLLEFGESESDDSDDPWDFGTSASDASQQDAEPQSPPEPAQSSPKLAQDAGTEPSKPSTAVVRVAGIDLGTTYSAVSSYSPRQEFVETLPLTKISDGSTVPSVVYYPEKGDPVVGNSALSVKSFQSERVIEAIKKAMGENPPWKRVIDGKNLTAESVSSEILKAVFACAESTVSKDDRRVVITVPAHFQDPHLEATRRAGEMAGLEVMALLPEPHAAALAFTVERVSNVVEDQTEDLTNQHLLVFDLGGGTLDVALIRIATDDASAASSFKFETLTKSGHRALGGLNWDAKLKEAVLEKFRDEADDDEYDQQTNGPMFHPELEKRIETAKRSLTDLEQVGVTVGFRNIMISREEFEDATSGLLMQCQSKLEEVLEDAKENHGVRTDQLKVVMAGGSTKMPQIPEMIKSVTGTEPLESRNPDLLVTVGAAYWAHVLANGGPVTGGLMVPTMTEIVDYSVGVKTFQPDQDGKYTIPIYSEIIPPGSKRGPAADTFRTRLDEYLEQAISEFNEQIQKGGSYGKPNNDPENGIFCDLYHKNADGATRIRTAVFSADESGASIDQAREMCQIELTLSPDGKRGDPVLAAMGHDADGILQGRFVDLNSGTRRDFIIERPS